MHLPSIDTSRGWRFALSFALIAVTTFACLPARAANADDPVEFPF